MSPTPSIDWTRHGTTTPSRYRFVLSFVLYSENGTLELVNAPLEWKEIELELKRDPETHGVYLSAVVESLTFIKEGKDLIEELYASKGVFSQCTLYIYYLDFTTREYLSMPSTYKLDFNSRSLINLTKTTNGVRIACLAEDMVSKFQQRKNTVVDLNKLKGLSGFTINNYTALKKNLYIGAIDQYNSASFANSDVNNYSLKSADISVDTTEYVYAPMVFSFSDFSEAANVVYAVKTGYDGASAFLTQMVEERDLVIKGNYNFTINELSGLNSTLFIYLVVLDVSNSVLISRTLASYTEGASGAKAIAIDESFTAQANAYIAIVAVAYMEAGSTDEISVAFGASDIQATQAISSSPAITAQSFPIYEAIERNLQIILDTQFPLYSEFFGRTDTPYNVADDCYVSENQLRFANIMTGICLRQMPIGNQPLPMKFMDLFKALKAVWNVGGGFETVGSELMFRIEDLAHFYQESETLDLSARVNELEIEREQLGDRMFQKIKTGFNKFEYESVMGRGEYNTLQTRTTVVPNDNEFDNVIPLRGDTKGILDLILKNIHTTGTEDVSGDEDVFIIKSQRGAVQDWDAETDENIVIEDNTSLFQTGSLNLYLTPLRNLIRNGRIVNAGLALMPGTEVTYQTSDKNASLKTTGEGITITENENIATEDLATPLWYPELLTIELPFYEADYIVLAASPLGYITLSENLSGWVIDVRWKFAQNLATLKLLRRIPV